MLADLMRQLRPLHRDTSPFGTAVPAHHMRTVHWVEPRPVEKHVASLLAKTGLRRRAQLTAYSAQPSG